MATSEAADCLATPPHLLATMVGQMGEQRRQTLEPEEAGNTYLIYGARSASRCRRLWLSPRERHRNLSSNHRDPGVVHFTQIAAHVANLIWRDARIWQPHLRCCLPLARHSEAEKIHGVVDMVAGDNQPTLTIHKGNLQQS
jgi:hypothetical protein